jgi:peptidoglycan/LPS O-acetylase OafA/YrhL
MAQPGEHIASNRYFRAIDGLRLLASVNIALFHLAAIGGLYNMHGNPAWFFRIINGPAFHASAFFLLGGFIFSIKFAPTIGHFTTRAFITKRFKELYPLHAVTTLVMVILFIGRRYGTEVFSLPKLLFSTGIHLSMLWSVFPFHSYALNRPSWALSAFFLCYLLFGFFLKYVLQIKRKTLVLILAIVCMLPLFLWSLLYRNLGMPEHLYHFFHSFAPIRFFEFLIGMFLARFYQLSGSFIENRKIPIFNDLLILFSLTAIYANLHISAKDSPFLHWLSYHIFMTPLYAVLLFSLAVERGIIVRLLSLHWIRQIGKIGRAHV